MLNDLFFLNIDPEELSHKAWGKLIDASQYYSTASDSAEWAIFCANLYDNIEFFILRNVTEDYDFFAYITIEGTPYDVSGFHSSHEQIILDNEFYEENGFGDVVMRKTLKDDVLDMMGEQNTDFLMKLLVVEE